MYALAPHMDLVLSFLHPAARPLVCTGQTCCDDICLLCAGSASLHRGQNWQLWRPAATRQQRPLLVVKLLPTGLHAEEGGRQVRAAPLPCMFSILSCCIGSLRPLPTAAHHILAACLSKSGMHADEHAQHTRPTKNKHQTPPLLPLDMLKPAALLLEPGPCGASKGVVSAKRGHISRPAAAGAARFSPEDIAARVAAWERRQQSSQAASMAQTRAALPITAHRSAPARWRQSSHSPHRAGSWYSSMCISCPACRS